MKSNKKRSASREELKGKVVLITGGGQGIGKCMAIEFSKHDSKVIICSRTKRDLDKLKNEIKAFGGSCECFVADVSDIVQIKRLFQNVMNLYGEIHVLINCAGIYGPIGALDTNDMEMWKKTININLIGVVHTTHCVIPIMKKQKQGKIINISGGGIGGPNINPNFSAYTASKAAVVAFTEVMARELKSSNIQVNAISPGAVNTRLLDQVLGTGELAGIDFFEKSKKQKIEGGTPPEKAAKLAIFLATTRSDHITGKLLSAVWDDYENFDKIKNKLEETSFYNLRRIDDFMFFESRKL